MCLYCLLIATFVSFICVIYACLSGICDNVCSWRFVRIHTT